MSDQRRYGRELVDRFVERLTEIAETAENLMRLRHQAMLGFISAIIARSEAAENRLRGQAFSNGQSRERRAGLYALLE